MALGLVISSPPLLSANLTRTAVRSFGSRSSLNLCPWPARQFSALTRCRASGKKFRISTPTGPAVHRQMRIEATMGEDQIPVPAKDTIIPEPDYRLGIVVLSLTAIFILNNNLIPAIPLGLLGGLLVFQAKNAKFMFTKDALDVKVGDEYKDSGANVFVGGKNYWPYASFTNWEFWWPNFPVLVYFKETHTKPEGQIHFFPAIFNGKQVYDVLVERAGPSKNSGPK